MNTLSEQPAEVLSRTSRKPGFYYGWVVAIAGTIGVIMSVPGQTMGVSVYTNHLLQSLPINRVQLSLTYMLGTLASAALLPTVGRLLDRFGARTLGAIAPLCLALALLFLADSPRLLHQLTGHTSMPARWIAFSLVFIAFLGVRHFGQGQLTVVSRTMIGRWFERRRGLVFGISGLFVAFGFGVAPMTLNRLITACGWQGSLVELACVLAAMSIFAWITFRNSPEECGLVIDGGHKADAHTSKESKPEHSFTSHEASQTLTFWVFNFGLMGQALISTAVVFHMGRIGQLNGMSAERAFSVFLPVAVISTSCDLLGGALSDRLPLKYLLAFMQLGLCLGLLGLQHYGTLRGYAMTALGLGISNGLYSLLSGAAWPKLFGRRHLGAISGLSMAWIVAASAVGPYLFSLGQADSGSLHQVLLLSALLPAAVFAASFFANPPKRLNGLHNGAS
jgi:MFS family permease